MMDFTLKKYTFLLEALQSAGYRFVTFRGYCEKKRGLDDERFVILRHDVDRKAENALAVAKIEHERGIDASYYFRIVPQSNKPEIIKAIAEMGHEIGYHYEDMTICNGNAKDSITHFKKQLDYFRQYYPVKTICMHGAPQSKFDGRDLWQYFDYHNFEIIGEPYFDVDFSKVFYLTDTGRRWDGFNVSIRDKIPVYQDEWIRLGLKYHDTNDVINAIIDGKLPHHVMMTTHPQRWTDAKCPWLMELGSQLMKNMVKGLIVSKNIRNFALKISKEKPQSNENE